MTCIASYENVESEFKNLKSLSKLAIIQVHDYQTYLKTTNPPLNNPSPNIHYSPTNEQRNSTRKP